MSHHWSDNLEDHHRDLNEQIEELTREKDTLEHRLNDAEDLIRWIAGSKTWRGQPSTVLGHIRIQCRSFLKAGEWVYQRDAKLPECAGDK